MLVRRKARIRKAFVGLSLIFIILGVVLVAFSIQEPLSEERTIDRWDVGEPYSTLTPLTPHNLTAWAPTGEGSYFELNISASNIVRVRISMHALNFTNTGEEIWTDPVFDHFASRFTQKVTVKESSCLVEIKNEGTTPVNISGNISLKKTSVLYQSVYPYSSAGTLSLLVGSALLVYAVKTSRNERRSKSRR